ncbi:GerAB/ArcD/ProY family transporter [Brevibacillus dissolubilis]|uniref:GerAB/ArcD/ProY family transporter n=1 Tax=Brevibacillus dissolubilis TaxID=1844116 RepID=UPI0011160D02|nr:GerAB/ArcD/ProY family transporter [Brevibacillus dissolubilis]
MDQGKYKKLNPYHVFFLINNTMVGQGLLSISHALSPVGYNQYWIPFLLGVVTQLVLIPMYWLGMRYPEDNLYVINERLLGKWLGKLVNLVFLIYLIMVFAAVTHNYLRLVQAVTMPDRTMYPALIAILFVSCYIVLGGIKLVARFCMLGFFFTAWMMVYLHWGIQKGEFSHMLPLFNVNMRDVWQASYQAYESFFGYELLLVYFPYIVQQKRSLLHVSGGLWLTVLVYTGVSLVSVVYFSEWQLENLRYPVLNLFKAVELTFVERIENFGIALWVFLVLSTAAPYLWAAKKAMDAVMSHNRRIHLYVILVCAYLLARVQMPTWLRQKLFEDWSFWLGYTMVVIPVLLLLLSLIRKPATPAKEQPQALAETDDGGGTQG